jgi:hypothetical protein
MYLTSSSESAIPAWISIYPNPASEFVSIHLDRAPLTTNATFTLVNSQGALVAEGHLDNPTMEYVVNVSTFAVGLYTLTLFDLDQMMHTQSIIIE